MKTVTVTGGTGYIAGFVIAEFLNHGYAVRASVRNRNKQDLKTVLSDFVTEEALTRFTVFEADLTSGNGWAEGLSGSDGVIHIASPLGSGKETAEELRQIAVGGTLNVLRGALTAGVKRVVMTSSQAACTPRNDAGKIILDENYWSDETNPELDPYRLSKIASEKAAWIFAEENAMRLTTILPGAVFGRIMSRDNISTNEILLRLLNGGLPRSINIPFETSDVRDLALLHRKSFETDEAIGQRFLTASRIISMPEIARLYREHYPLSKTPKKVFSDWQVKLLAKFIPPLRQMIPMLGREYLHTTEKAERLFNWTPFKPEETVLDAAEAMMKLGMIK